MTETTKVEVFEADRYRRAYLGCILFMTALVPVVVSQLGLHELAGIPFHWAVVFFVLEVPLIGWAIWRLGFRRFAEYAFGSRLTFADDLLTIEEHGKTTQLAPVDVTAIERAEGFCTLVTTFLPIRFHLLSHSRRAELVARLEAFHKAGKDGQGVARFVPDDGVVRVFEPEWTPVMIALHTGIPAVFAGFAVSKVVSPWTVALVSLVALVPSGLHFRRNYTKHFSRVTLAGGTVTVEVPSENVRVQLVAADIVAIEKDGVWCTLVTKIERVRFHLIAHIRRDELMARINALRSLRPTS